MIGKIIKTMRKVKGITQEDLSRLTGIPQNTISQYETDKFEPNYNTLYKISECCGFEIEFVCNDMILTSENIDRKEL